MNRERIPIQGRMPQWRIIILCVLKILLVSIGTPTEAFLLTTTTLKNVERLSPTFRHCRCCNPGCRSASQIPPQAVAEAAAAAAPVLFDYSPAAASLFNNMKLPAAVVTAGMISLGFATRFPELPRDSLDRIYSQELRQRCAKLERLHVVLGLISVTSELIVVLWAAVEVNQLTERVYDPTYSVWELINSDCDLAWSAVNSHFIIGIIGFLGMLSFRAYVMLLVANASRKLMIAASTGTAASLCLMVSIVNRGVESGGGNTIDRYGKNVLDLFQHYSSLLLQAATDVDSPGPLQLLAMVLEITSLSFMFVVLLQENDASFEETNNEDSCPVDLYNTLNDGTEIANLSVEEIDKLETCIILEEEEQRRQEHPSMAALVEEEEENKRRIGESGDYSSVNVL